jgi:DNA-binding NarL/FixJ family response regulator
MIILASSDSAIVNRWRTAVAGALVVGRRAQLEEALAAERPSLLLLDLTLDGLGGASSVAELIGRLPATRVVVMSRAPDEDEGIAMLRVGARGYCNVYIDPRLLEKVITAVHAGEVWAGRRLVDRLVQLIASSAPPAAASEPEGFGALTSREREVALLVGEGVSNKIIAQRLDITERTVKAHLNAVFGKLGVPGRLQLALLVTGRAERVRAARTGPH